MSAVLPSLIKLRFLVVSSDMRHQDENKMVVKENVDEYSGPISPSPSR